MTEQAKWGKRMAEDVKIHERVATVETHIANIHGDIHEIKTNHLAHIEADVASLESDFKAIKKSVTDAIVGFQRWLIGLLAGIIVTLAVAIINSLKGP